LDNTMLHRNGVGQVCVGSWQLFPCNVLEVRLVSVKQNTDQPTPGRMAG
jgi:hypothetical protein